jgi:predicted ribosomally synthesized peptide with nif11-like leader
MDKLGKIEALKENKEFLAKIANLKNPEDIAAAFRAEGIEVTDEEIEKALNIIGENGELNENALEEVSGGFWTFIGSLALILIGASIASGFRDGASCK